MLNSVEIERVVPLAQKQRARGKKKLKEKIKRSEQRPFGVAVFIIVFCR